MNFLTPYNIFIQKKRNTGLTQNFFTRNRKREYKKPIKKLFFPVVFGIISWGISVYCFKKYKLDAYFKQKKQNIFPERDPSKKYTLIIGLENILVCWIWDTDLKKWRFAIRPGAELFLFYISRYYEIIIYSNMSPEDRKSIVSHLDPFSFISYSVSYEKNKPFYFSDLNRKEKTILSFGVPKMEKRNIFLKKWKGDLKDIELEKSIPFFEEIASSKYEDINLYSQRYKNNIDFFEKNKTENNIIDGIIFKYFGGKNKNLLKKDNERKMKLIKNRRIQYSKIVSIALKNEKTE